MIAVTNRPDDDLEFDQELRREFGNVVDLLSEGPLPALERPGPGVWQAIALEAGVPMGDIESEPALADAGKFEEGLAARAREKRSAARRTKQSSSASRGWGKSVAIGFGIAAAVMLVAFPLAAVFFGGDSATRNVTLEPVGEYTTRGSAEVESGELTLVVDDLEGAPDDAFYEVWLLEMEDGEILGLESLGRYDGEQSLSIPDDVDIDRYSTVDVSLEPDDGDPDHSGDSLMRGELS